MKQDWTYYLEYAAYIGAMAVVGSWAFWLWLKGKIERMEQRDSLHEGHQHSFNDQYSPPDARMLEEAMTDFNQEPSKTFNNESSKAQVNATIDYLAKRGGIAQAPLSEIVRQRELRMKQSDLMPEITMDFKKFPYTSSGKP